MNAQRRKAISNIISKMEDIRFELSFIVSDEHELLKNIPDLPQNTDRMEETQENISDIDLALYNIYNAILCLKDVHDRTV